MTTYPAPLARLIQEMSKLPGIGEKTAARLAFHLLKGKKDDVFRLADSIGKLRQEMGLCDRCFGFSDISAQNGDGALCEICRNPERESDKICVVEEPADLIAELGRFFVGLAGDGAQEEPFGRQHVSQRTAAPLGLASLPARG